MENPARALFPDTFSHRVPCVLFLAVLVLTTTLSAVAAHQDDIVYVESNQTTGNSILAFRNNGFGNLSLFGSWPAGGIGVFDPTFGKGPFDADQQLQISPDRKLLFAVNSGSNTIAVFQINPDGTLEPVEGSPFPSNGSDPVSVGVKAAQRGHDDDDDEAYENVLVVANKDQDPRQNPGLVLPNYTAFRVAPGGQLTPVPDSTISVAYFSSPAQALISPLGGLVFGADFQGGLLESLSIDERGRLRQNPTTPLPDSEFIGSPVLHFLEGLWGHPSQPILYVGFVSAAKMGVFRYNGDGKLSFVRTVPNSGQLICWIRVNRLGTRVYTVNSGDNSVSVYDSTNAASPAEIQHLHLVNNTGAPLSLVLDRSEEFLYVVTTLAGPTSTAAGNGIHVLKIAADGTLSEVGSPTTVPVSGVITRVQGIEVF